MPKNKKKSKTATCIVVLLLFLACVAAGFFISKNSLFIKDKSDVSGEIAEQQKREKENDKTSDSSVSEEAISEDKTPVKYDGEDPNSLEGLTGYVTYAGIVNDKVMIRVNINQYLSTGSCTLVLGSYEETVSIVGNASTSTCEGFDVSLSSLAGMNGDYAFDIQLDSESKKGNIEGSLSL